MASVNPWSRYWGNSNSQRSFFSRDGEDEADIIQFWQGFSDELDSDARILDLATGNGIVPKMLLDYKPTFQVVGVDKALIKPELFFTEKTAPGKFEFRSDVDVCNLPFASDSFDGVSSQFGIEYATGFSAYDEVSRVLKPSGRFQFLVHHSESEPLQSSRLKTQEMSALKHPQGVLACLEKFTHDQGDFALIEAAGADYLKSDQIRTKPISGQIFNAIDRILGLFSTNKPLAIQLVHDLLERFQAQYERLTQMQDAAKNADEMTVIIKHLETCDLKGMTLEAFHVGSQDKKALVGWSLSGCK